MSSLSRLQMLMGTPPANGKEKAGRLELSRDKISEMAEHHPNRTAANWLPGLWERQAGNNLGLDDEELRV